MVGEGDECGLLTVVRRLARARTEAEIMAAVSCGVRTLLHADGATFVWRDGDGCYYADEDAISPLWTGRRIPMDACIAGWCMTNRQAAAVPDIYRDSRIFTDVYRPTFVRSLAMAPVGVDEPLAAIGAYWSDRRESGPDEMERLQAIADAAALAVANVQARQAAQPDRRASTPSQESSEPQPSPPFDRAALRGAVDRVRRSRLRPNSPEAFAFAVLCVAAATLLRLAAGASGEHGLVIYSTYYPWVVLALIVGGRWSGVAACVLGGLSADWFFMPPLYRLAPVTASNAINMAIYFGSCGLILVIVDRYKRALLRLRHEDARHLTLAREQHHRVRNAVAVVESIVKLSLKDEPERVNSINRRIRASLAEIDIRDKGAEQPTRLRDLLAAELQPYDLGRFTLDGDDGASLPADSRNILALAIHELTTNALKYGALSVPDGRVRVAWRTLDSRVAISWRETGGPPVKPPRKRGYGSIMLRRLVEAAGGALTTEFPPSGAIAEISLPLEPRRSRTGPSDAAA
jgi:two-component sensor histidine kinase